MRRDLLLAVAASLAVVLGAPYVGQIRGRIQDALPGQYRTIVAAIVIGAVIAALVAAVARIREGRFGWPWVETVEPSRSRPGAQ